MIQKYQIVRDKKNDSLTIKEFAILEKVWRNVEFQEFSEEDFSLIGEQIYEDEMIKTEILKGKQALISVLRTKNLYPISFFSNAIAESIIDLYSNKNSQPVELVFDDAEAIKD